MIISAIKRQTYLALFSCSILLNPYTGWPLVFKRQILGEICKKDNNDMENLGDFLWNLQNFSTDFQLLQ